MNGNPGIFDGNEAAAYIAYKVSEICAIYPITPSSTMGELADVWSAAGRKNIWGGIPSIIELQSEGGAAGTLHGALQAGSLATTFTASQGLLLMIPNMYKISGEMLPSVFHIAARSIATHALSIFGDHSDVMACRQTGFALLFSSSVQEAMDMALIAHSSTLLSRIPFLHAFDGFRTSHEINKIDVIPDEVIRKMIDEKAVHAHRDRGLTPQRPVIRGTSQNPDVFFQGREASNSYYDKLPAMVQERMDLLAKHTGRSYRLYEYEGHPEADRVIVVMGSACGTVAETVEYLNRSGEKVGMLKVRLYRPFSARLFADAVPASVKSIAVLDRTKEPGSAGEPLYQDTLNAFAETSRISSVRVIGGRYGLSSKEFTPAMVKAVFEELKKESPKNHFTVGINDDVTFHSLDFNKNFSIPSDCFSAMFYGLGSDGTVGANKNTVKIIGETTPDYVQGYFVYDSKKAGALTISHLRFGKKPLRSEYLIDAADFVACHQFNFLPRYDVLENIKKGGVFLLNAPHPADEVWAHIPEPVQRKIIDCNLRFFVVDATRAAMDAGLGGRINTILQTCFFSISGILPREEALEKIRQYIHKSYSHKGDAVVNRNLRAVNQALVDLHEVKYHGSVFSSGSHNEAIPDEAPEMMKKVLAKIIEGKGNNLPVSAFPADGTFISATAQWEKRNIALHVPEWDTDLCTQCGKCVLICPHAAIRSKVYDNALLDSAPLSFRHALPVGKDFDRGKETYTLQVAVEDCTGCHLCVEYCPVADKKDLSHKAINMVPQAPVKEKEKKNWEYFLGIPESDSRGVNKTSIKGVQFLRPLFEFSGACAGCGETPYLKLLTQLFGDEMIVANATGCSSIYGGNLPTTPWAKNKQGRGPAWANSLFEDNAEFGLGMRLSVNNKREQAIECLKKMEGILGSVLVNAVISQGQQDEEGRKKMRTLIHELVKILHGIDTAEARQMEFLADYLARKSMWIVGGDGWAYDIGFGGLDHILSLGEDLNILVMDTEVYSNTGGQTSKSTPIGASAKFSISGKRKPKKRLAMQAISYGNVYVAQVAMGASDVQTLRAINEANDYPGTSLVIAYTHCIEHGYDMRFGARQQDKAVKSAYWPLFRYNPLKPQGQRFTPDSKEAGIPLKDYIYNESRYTRLLKQDEKFAKELLHLAEEEVSTRWNQLQSLAGL